MTCYHEAGHCLSRWYFGHFTDGAHVLTVEQVMLEEWPEDLRGRLVVAEGHCAGYDIASKFFPLTSVCDEHRRSREIAVEMQLVLDLAGIHAEAAYRKCHPAVVALIGGDADMKTARELAAASFRDASAQNAAMGVASKRAATLVRSPKGRDAIKAMAAKLFDAGEIDGDDVEHLCSAVYGQPMPQFGAWDDCWPPSTAAIRAGWLPRLTGRFE